MCSKVVCSKCTNEQKTEVYAVNGVINKFARAVKVKSHIRLHIPISTMLSSRPDWLWSTVHSGCMFDASLAVSLECVHMREELQT